MSWWNYRVMRHKTDEGWWYGVYEVYYNEEGKPEKHSANPDPVVGEGVGDLQDTLDRFKLALKKPVLEWEEGKGYREVTE